MWRQRSGAATPCRSEGGDPLKGPRQAVGRPAQTAGPVTSWREAAGVAAQPEPEDGAAGATEPTPGTRRWGARFTRSGRGPLLPGGGEDSTTPGGPFGVWSNLD